jgi:hypothetical protein
VLAPPENEAETAAEKRAGASRGRTGASSRVATGASDGRG